MFIFINRFLLALVIVVGIILIPSFSCAPVTTKLPQAVVAYQIKVPGPLDPLDPVIGKLTRDKPLFPWLEGHYEVPNCFTHPDLCYCVIHPEQCYKYTSNTYPSMEILWRTFDIRLVSPSVENSVGESSMWLVQVKNTSEKSISLQDYVLVPREGEYFQPPPYQLQKGQEIQIIWFGSPSDKLNLYQLPPPQK